MPTAHLRGRLVAMASRRGLVTAGTPAAYSSMWGNEHRQAPHSTRLSGPTAAAAVLGEGHSGTLPGAEHRQVQV